MRALRARWGCGAVASAVEGECTARRLGSAHSPKSATLSLGKRTVAQGALDSVFVAGLRVLRLWVPRADSGSLGSKCRAPGPSVGPAGYPKA